MDFSTLGGLILGLVILLAALIIGHVPLETLLNPEALLVVFGGTLTATWASFHVNTLKRAIRAFWTGGSPESRLEVNTTIAYVMDVVGFVRDEGILALQPIMDSIDIPFFKKGLQLVLDNRSPKFIRDSLSTEIEVCYRERLDDARVYETAGGFSPTMGIIGAVIGLIHIVETSHNPSQLGKGVASAFSATLYGVACANLFLLPMAARLRQRARDEWFMMTLLLEAILSIRAGDHPMMIEERLNVFVSGQQGAEKPNKRYMSYPKSTTHSSDLNILPARTVLDEEFLQVEPWQ